MKTTAGKTKAARPGNRPVMIYAEGHRGVVAVRNAPTLKQALEEYFKESLAPRGYAGKRIVGNVLQCTLKGNTRSFTALEEYQTR